MTINQYDRSGRIFGFNNLEEKKVYDYNCSSIVPFPENDYGFIINTSAIMHTHQWLEQECMIDLFNKVLGRKKIDSTTPKPSDKPNQSSPVTNRSSGDAVKKAEESFNEDDGNIPVKDEQVRKFTARLLGAGLENKLNVINYSVGELSNEVKSLNTNLVHTQKLVYDRSIPSSGPQSPVLLGRVASTDGTKFCSIAGL